MASCVLRRTDAIQYTTCFHASSMLDSEDASAERNTPGGTCKWDLSYPGTIIHLHLASLHHD